MRLRFKLPEWFTTGLLLLLAPVIGYLVFVNVEDTRQHMDAGAQNDTEAQMIAFLHQQYDSRHPRFGFHWLIQRRDGSKTLVCYCDRNGYGWWYEVQAGLGGFSATKVADTSAHAESPPPPLPVLVQPSS